MPNDDSDTLSTAYISDPLVPITTDKERITHEDNDACIEGNLYEVGRFLKRTGLLQLFLKHRAVKASHGKIAVDSVNAVYYTSGRIVDPHDFDDPCPPSDERHAKSVALYTAAGKGTPLSAVEARQATECKH